MREIQKLSHSFRWAARGIGLCVRYERNFRIHTAAAAYVLVFALAAGFSAERIGVLMLCFGLMLGAEMVNTAIEILCDKQAHGYDNTVRDAKDIAAGAVFVCAMACVVVGIVYFFNPATIRACWMFFTGHIPAMLILLASIPCAVVYIFKIGRKP